MTLMQWRKGPSDIDENGLAKNDNWWSEAEDWICSTSLVLIYERKTKPNWACVNEAKSFSGSFPNITSSIAQGQRSIDVCLSLRFIGFYEFTASAENQMTRLVRLLLWWRICYGFISCCHHRSMNVGSRSHPVLPFTLVVHRVIF